MYSRIVTSSRPAVETKYPLAQNAIHKVALPLSVRTGQVHCTLAFDKTGHLGDRILWRDRDHHMHMIWHEVTLFDPAFLLQGQFAEHIPEILPQFPRLRSL